MKKQPTVEQAERDIKRLKAFLVRTDLPDGVMQVARKELATAKARLIHAQRRAAKPALTALTALTRAQEKQKRDREARAAARKQRNEKYQRRLSRVQSI